MVKIKAFQINFQIYIKTALIGTIYSDEIKFSGCLSFRIIKIKTPKNKIHLTYFSNYLFHEALSFREM